LFNSLQFLLTVGFGWFSTRAITRIQFEDSIKRFAISAYRRIADIQRIARRLQGQIQHMMVETSSTDSHHLSVVDAIVSDMCQVIRSSISDWSDVIGSELITLERIDRLEQERQEMSGDLSAAERAPNASTELRRIEQEKAQLIDRLPAGLRSVTEADEWSEPEQRRAAEWMAMGHREVDGLRIRVVAGGEYGADQDPQTLQAGQLLRLRTGGNWDRGLDVEDESGALLGRLLNATPLTYEKFLRTLERCYGYVTLPLEYLEHDYSRTIADTTYWWYTVKVTAAPTVPSPNS